ALGTVLADALVRAGVGRVTLVDRDIVELTNLQRQTLFAEADVGSPKVIAAMARLAEINRHTDLHAEVRDVGPDNIELLIERSGATLLLDGTDNAATRYLINDVALKRGLPWVYGGCVGVEGRVMTIVPSPAPSSKPTPCLRCVFPEPPLPGEVATCDVAGVLGPAAGIVANLQAAAAIRILVGEPPVAKLLTLNAWDWRFREIDLADAKSAACPCCGHRRFEFLNSAAAPAASLCGRNSVQVRTHVSPNFSLDRTEAALRDRFDVHRTEYLISLDAEPGIGLTLFADGRALVHGTADPARARAIVSRYLG
ncbi:MAG: UBA/THIF-type binding protein, partial [Phycisphaerales bacterium]|nr:UBA/THIF-type binding protein [Phycisphaerales bacterium]